MWKSADMPTESNAIHNRAEVGAQMRSTDRPPPSHRWSMSNVQYLRSVWPMRLNCSGTQNNHQQEYRWSQGEAG
jgi:hypothetical protein